MPSIQRALVALSVGLGLLAAAQAAPASSTAQANVQVLPTPFAVPGLNRAHTVRLYLQIGRAHV